MCLSVVYDDEKMAEAIEALPEVVEVWKVVEMHSLTSAFACLFGLGHPRTDYKYGFNKATVELVHTVRARYYSGFHFFAQKTDAASLLRHAIDYPWTPWYSGGGFCLIRCFIKTAWITAIGFDMGRTIVAEKAFFPTYPETEAKLEDFLAWQKENESPVKSDAVAEFAPQGR